MEDFTTRIVALNGTETRSLSVKRCFAVDGQINDACSQCLLGYRAKWTAEVIRLLSRSFQVGTIDRGGEFCVGVDTMTGQGKSMIYDGHKVGGSSGGTAMAIWSRYSDLGLGTDTGGSIRDVTWAFARMIGFKPSYGVISRSGVIPLCNDLDTVGLLSYSWEVLYASLLITSRGAEDATLDDLALRKMMSLSKMRFKRVLIFGKPQGIENVVSRTSRFGVSYTYSVTNANLDRLLKLMDRVYQTYTGAYLVSNTLKYWHMDYSKLDLGNLDNSHFRKVPELEISEMACKRRVSWGQVYFASPTLRRALLRSMSIVDQVKELINGYDLILFDSRERPHLLLLANFDGVPSASFGNLTFHATARYSDLALLRWIGLFCD